MYIKLLMCSAGRLEVVGYLVNIVQYRCCQMQVIIVQGSPNQPWAGSIL
jgi:hypothetical protein